MTEHDFSDGKSGWGHAISLREFTPAGAKAVIFDSSPVRDGDVVIFDGKRGPMRGTVTVTQHPADPGDMYFVDVVPA